MVFYEHCSVHVLILPFRKTSFCGTLIIIGVFTYWRDIYLCDGCNKSSPLVYKEMKIISIHLMQYEVNIGEVYDL